MSSLYTFNRDTLEYDVYHVSELSDIYTTKRFTNHFYNPIREIPNYNYILIDWDNHEYDIHQLFKLSLCKDHTKERLFLDSSVSYPKTTAFRRTRKIEKSRCIVTPLFTKSDYHISRYYILKDTNTGDRYILESSSSFMVSIGMYFKDLIKENNLELYNTLKKALILENTFLNKFSSLVVEKDVRMIRLHKNMSFLLSFNPLEGKMYIPIDILFKLSEHRWLSEKEVESISNGIYSNDLESCKHALLVLINSNVLSIPKGRALTLFKDGLIRVGKDIQHNSRVKLVKTVLGYTS